MKKPLRVLVVEDSEDDTLLMIYALKKGGNRPEYDRVETAEAMLNALQQKSWDVILCDYEMPQFNGLAAITLLKDTGIDIPLIIVSGVIGEETAVECMRLGARDFFMKGRLSRLAAAVERELNEAESRRQRKQAEDARQESEKRYKGLFENASMGIFHSLPEGRFLRVNSALARMMGYESPEEIISSITDIGSQIYVDSKRRSDLVSDTLEKDGWAYAENRYRRKDGAILIANLALRRVLNHNGTVAYLEGFVEDITKRKQAEENLRTSEQRLSDIVDFLPDATLVIDKEGKVIAWNRAIEAMTGVKAEDMLGKGDHEYALPFYGERRMILVDLALHPDPEREKSYTHIQRMGDILFGEAYTPSLPGGKIHLSATASVLRSPEGEIVAAIECIRDDTERRQAQEKLSQAEERYRGIFENAQEGIYRLTPEGRIILANKAMATMLGFDSPEELMTSINDVAPQLYVHPEEREVIINTIEEYGFIRNHEVQLCRKDGSVFWVSATMQAVRDAKGQILYYEGIDEDITERKENIERMRKALGATVQAIAVTVEARDPYTSGHQRRVADLSRAIATEMELPKDQIEGLRIAATIHDIGKISVPAEILSMPRKLTDIEYALIKTHVQSAHNILKDIEFPWPIERMILEHHEKLDGSGYPNGLKGEEILIESRILTLADVVEAIASHRPYRPSLGINSAMEEITRQKGIHYDPEVVDACLRLIYDKGYKLAE